MKKHKTEWFKELYDDFRMRTGFGNISEEESKRDVDFMFDVLKLKKGHRVLDLFCGVGRHSIELSKRGSAVTGVEYNVDYLHLARERASTAFVKPKFIQGDVRNVKFGKGFDAVVIMYQSFGYFEDADEVKILKKVYDSLRPGGHFLMEILNRDWILRNYATRNDRIVQGIKVAEERSFDVLTSRVNSKITRYEGERCVVKKISWRLYSAHEIKNILEEIGFKFIAGYGGIDKDPLTLGTRLMRLVFKKPRTT